jgi:hypothetical protein
MSRIVRTIALSGAAAAAVLATAATATADTPEAATVAVHEAVANATGAPVTLPSGKAIRVAGMDSVSYRADAAHRTAVVKLAATPTPEPDNGWVGTPPGANGTAPDPRLGSVPQQVPGYGPQQITTQAGAGAVSVTVVAGLVLCIVVGVLIKKSGLKVSWAILCIALGVLLAPTFIGPLVETLSGNGISAFGSIWAGL